MSENILSNIIIKKIERVDALKKTISLDSLNEIIGKNNTFINFKEKIQNNIIQYKISIIAEIKKASPSAGIIVENYDPKDISYLDEKRIYWSRCNVNDSKQLEHVMKNIWNSQRFNIIIDNTSNYETLRRYGIGKYYKEANNEIFCHSCKG